jgi:hypothetical protein
MSHDIGFSTNGTGKNKPRRFPIGFDLFHCIGISDFTAMIHGRLFVCLFVVAVVIPPASSPPALIKSEESA